MKHRSKLSSYLFGAIIALILHCGTEVANPGLTVDMTGARGFIGRPTNTSPSVDQLSARVRAQISTTNEILKTVLFKYTTDGQVLPALTLNKVTDEKNIPLAQKITRIGDYHYVLFYPALTVDGNLCLLVEVDMKNHLRCIDNGSVPAGGLASNASEINSADQRSLFIARGKAGEIYYLAKTVSTGESTAVSRSEDASISNMGSKLAVLYPDGTRSLLTQDHHHVFKKLIQDPSGGLYALDYGRVEITGNAIGYEQLFHYCKLENGACSNMLDPSVSTKEFSYIPLDEGKILFSSYDTDEPLHLRLGSVGELVNETNFTQDLKAGQNSDDVALTESMVSAFNTDGEKVYGFNGLSSPGKILQMAPEIEAIELPDAQPVIDYRAGRPIVMAFCNTGVDCKLIALNPATNEKKELNIPIGIKSIYSLRYVADDLILFSARNASSANNATKNEIYRYDVRQDQTEEIFELETTYSYIIHPINN